MAPTLESCTHRIVFVQKYVHESNKKATLRPLLKKFKFLCGPALELKLFTEKKLEGSIKKYAACAASHPLTTEKVMHVFLSSDLADFILIDFRLLDYL